MRSIQSYHMKNRGWDDIGYNFGIGGDGRIYEGRGFGLVGAHATGWNRKSIGIMFIGNYKDNEPNHKQIAEAFKLIQLAVAENYLTANYTIYGHRQLNGTECPGEKLYNEIKLWPHWRMRT